MRYPLRHRDKNVIYAATRDRTGDLQIFSLTLSQLSYSGFRIRGSNPCLSGESRLS
jgi:hypothetical protein